MHTGKIITLAILLLAAGCGTTHRVSKNGTPRNNPDFTPPPQTGQNPVLLNTIGTVPSFAERRDDSGFYYYTFVSNEMRFQDEAEINAYNKALSAIADMVCGVSIKKDGTFKSVSEGEKSGIIDTRIHDSEILITRTRGVLKKNLSPLSVSRQWKRTIKHGIVEKYWVTTLYVRISKTDRENLSVQCLTGNIGDTVNSAKKEYTNLALKDSSPKLKKWAESFLPSDIPGWKEGSIYGIGVSSPPMRDQSKSYRDAFKNAVIDAAEQAGVKIALTDENITTLKSKKSRISDPMVESKRVETLQVKTSFGKTTTIDVSQQEYTALSGNGSRVTLWKYHVAVKAEKPETLEETAGRLVDELAANLKDPDKENIPVPLAMGKFTYGETDCSGDFIEGFKDLVEGKATVHTAFAVKGRVKIGQVSHITGDSPDRETVQARIMKADILHGRYNDVENRVAVTAFITDVKGRISSATVYIDKAKIKNNMIAEGCGENMDILSAIEPLQASEFNFRLWTDKPGGTYKVEDIITIFVQCSERCYLKVFNIDKKGDVGILEDTGETRLLRDKEYSFTVKAITPGIETLIAMASSEPFPYENSLNEPIHGDEFPVIFNNLRRFKGKKAEYKTTFTIVNSRGQ